jgi:transposase
MTVPGVNVIVAASFLAAIGAVRRFESPRELVGYLGLDPARQAVGHKSGDPRADLEAGLAPGRGRMLGDCPA